MGRNTHNQYLQGGNWKTYCAERGELENKQNTQQLSDCRDLRYVTAYKMG